MIHSMTGFARQHLKTEQGELCWEIRSVNHRHLEVYFRMPDSLRDLEPIAREVVRSHIQRGKVDISLSLDTTLAHQQLHLNLPLVQQLVAVSQKVAHITSTAQPLSIFEVLRWPGVLDSEEQNLDQLRTQARQLLEKTLITLKEMRAREGSKIEQVLRTRLDQIQQQMQIVTAILPSIQQHYQERIKQRFAEAQLEIDPTRLEQEMLLLIQRSDVAEELDRLEAHCQEMRHILEQGGVNGRRLDFLMQELNREANTLGSKSISPQTTKVSVELKVLIEQMREQIQNIE